MKKIEKEIVIKSSRKIKKLNLIFLLIFILIIFAGIFIFSKKENVFTNVFKSKKAKIVGGNIPVDLKVGDRVYYNYREISNPNKYDLTQLNLGKGSASKSGTGIDGNQFFNVLDNNFMSEPSYVHWYVFDINRETGEVTLATHEKSRKGIKIKGAIGHIWWEETAHKFAGMLGHGYGANEKKEFEYKVGSKIDTLGDTEIRKTQGTGGRAMTLNDIEKFLNLTEEKKKQNYYDYGKEHNHTSIKSPLRDIGQDSTSWFDKENAVSSVNNVGKIKNQMFGLIKREDFSHISNANYAFGGEPTSFATTLLDASSDNSIFYRIPSVYRNEIYTYNITTGASSNSDFNGFFSSNHPPYENNSIYASLFIRPMVVLKPNIKYIKITEKDGSNFWNIIDKGKNIKFNIQKSSDFNIENLQISIGETQLVKKDNVFEGTIENPKKQEVSGSSLPYIPIFNYKVKNNKVKPIVTGLPEGYIYKIKEADNEGYIDVNQRDVFILEIITQKYDNIKIGDIVYYNHKKAFDLNKENLTKVTFNKGSASESGTGIDGTQEFDAKNENLYWRVWDINKVTGEITLISAWNKNTQAINTKGSIGYLWFEETAHKIAGTLGYGYGANTKKEFSYKVGSGIESLGDTEVRKTIGTGAKPLTLNEAEKKLEITYSQKKQITSNYGNVYSPSVYSLLRDIGQPDSEWIDKSKAKSVLKNFNSLTDESYRINISPHTNQFYNILIPNEGAFSLATTLKGVDNNTISFKNFFVGNNTLGYGFEHVRSSVYGSDEYFHEYEIGNRFRYLVTLKPNIKLKKVDDEVDAWDIENEIENKNVKLTIKNESGENIDNIKVNIDGNNFNKVGNIFTGIAKVENGQTRVGTKENAVFTYISNSSKEINVSGIPESCDWKITGNAEGDKKLDLNKGNEFEIVLYRNGYEHKVNVEYENGESASFSGKLKLKKGEELVKEITFSNKETEVSLGFVPIYDGYTLEFENVGTSSHELSIINNKKVKVKYIPEKAIAWVELDFYGDICENLEEHEVQLINKDGYERIYIKLKKSENWTKSLEVPDTNLRGEKMRYAIYGGDEGVPGFAQVDYLEYEEEFQGVYERHYILGFRRLGNMPYSGVKKLGVMGTISVGCVIFAVAQFNYKKKFWLRGINFSK